MIPYLDATSEKDFKSEFENEEFKVLNKTYKIQNGLSIWESQLNKIIEDNSFTMQNDLELLKYEYVREIVSLKDLEIVKNKLRNNNNLFPVYKNNSEQFTIGVNKGISANYDDFLNLLIPTTETMLLATHVKKDKSTLSEFYIFEENDISMVNLVWEYEGKILNTICLVSEKKGIIYDKFLYFIHISIKTESVRSTSSTIPRLKSSSIEGPSVNISYRFTRHDTGYAWYGGMAWDYLIMVHVTGSKVGSVKTITDKTYNTYADYSWGYKCVAKIDQKSFQTGSSGHFDFSWGYAYGDSSSIGLSLGGSGYAITGGGTGSTGNEYVSPNELN